MGQIIQKEPALALAFEWLAARHDEVLRRHKLRRLGIDRVKQPGGRHRGSVLEQLPSLGGLEIIQEVSLRLQIAQRRSYLYTVGSKVGIIYILGALGFRKQVGPTEEGRSHRSVPWEAMESLWELELVKKVLDSGLLLSLT